MTIRERIAANQALFERVRRLVGRRTVLVTNTFRVSKGLAVETGHSFYKWTDDETETVRDRLVGHLVGGTTASNNLRAKEDNSK